MENPLEASSFPSQTAGNANNWLCHLTKYRRVTLPLPTTMLFTDIQAWLYTSHQCPLWLKSRNSGLHFVCYHHDVCNIILPWIVWYREAALFGWFFGGFREMYIMEELSHVFSSHCQEAPVRWKLRGRKSGIVVAVSLRRQDWRCLWIHITTLVLPFDHRDMMHRRRRKLLCFITDSTTSHWILLDTFCH